MDIKIWNGLMRGLTRHSLKRHRSLMPLFCFWGLGMTLAFSYLTRLTTRGLDVCWDKENIPHPNLAYKPTTQYKFFSPLRDYSKESFPSERPNID